MLVQRDGYWHIRLSIPGLPRIRRSTGVPVAQGQKHAPEAARKEHDRVEREALARLAEKARAQGEGETPTLEQAYDRARVVRTKWRDADERTLESTLQQIYRRWPKTTRLGEITQQDAEEWLREMLQRKLAPTTVNTRISMLNVLFKENGLTPPKLQRSPLRRTKPYVIPMDVELKAIAWFRERNLHEMADLVICLVDTGFRLSEMLRVTSSDVDWEAGTVACWENKADEPRIIPMTERVKDILKRRPRWWVTADRAQKLWKKMRRGIGYGRDKRFRIHALRHTCASRLAAAGVDANRLQAWMGHKSITTTQLYVHLFGPQLKGLADVLNSLTRDVGRDTTGENDLTTEPASRGKADKEQVDTGLLIRRSLVRAQVGEPNQNKDLPAQPNPDLKSRDTQRDTEHPATGHFSPRVKHRFSPPARYLVVNYS